MKQFLKQFFLWAFERGSFQYDVMCGIILAFMFLTPSWILNDKPDFMEVSATRTVKTSDDRYGNPIFTVKLEKPVFFDGDVAREEARQSLRDFFHEPRLRTGRMQPIHDWTGRLIAYAVWIERGKP